MSQPNQPVTEKGTDKPKTVKIRMKPGCGRMLIGRSWRLFNGTLSHTMPEKPEERLMPVDEYLEAREIDSDGNPMDGPVAEIAVERLAAMLQNGKPSREIDGYQMVKIGGGMENDSSGKPVRTQTSFAPRAEAGKFDDCTFEIVK